MEHRGFFSCVCVCLLLTAAASVLGQEAVKDQATCYTTWDDNYFYFACKVDCPDVRSTHTAPNADVTGDDSVSIFIESDNKRASQPTPNCFSMTVSAAAGSQFRAGSDKGTLDPTPVWTFKYGSTVQGTINNGDDVDMGYSVEIAIPWDLMKVKAPKPGDMISFNVLVNRHGADNAKPISLSPRVVTADDVLNPSRWVNLVLVAYSFGATMPGGEKMLSARSIVRPPLINGIIQDREWPTNSMFAIDLPTDPGLVYEAKYPIPKLVFTRYFYWYQRDPRRPAPYTDLAAIDGGVQLQDFPVDGPGPWFSSDRVQWHKDQLLEISSCGIDVVLPVYRGDRSSRAAFAAKGLDCLITALAELKAEGKPHPQVGMFFDPAAMEAAYGEEKPNPEDDEVKRTFYGMIKDFFDRVPLEFRAWAQTGKPNAGKPADIVFLGSSGFFSDLPADYLDYARDRYQRDFGRSLVWIAPEGRLDPQGFDGVCIPAAGIGSDRNDVGRIRVACVRAGLDNSATAEPASVVIRSRMGGKTYEDEWSSALQISPHWVVCDTWNNFLDGSEICASREYGRKYVDITRAQIARFKNAREFDVRYLRVDVPTVIPQRQFATAEVVLCNTGSLPWRVAEGFAVGYRWYRSGRFHGESSVRRPLGRDVAPGETVELSVGIATVTAQGAALPEGDFELRIELIRQSDGKWLSALGAQPLIVPVTVGQVPEWKASYVQCSAPVMMESARDYRVTLRVRNDGSSIWPRGQVKLGCRLYRKSTYVRDNPTEISEEVPIKSVRVLLARDCKPGEIAEFAFPLNLCRPDKKPLQASSPDYAWSYQLRFDLYNGKNWLSETGSRTLDRVVGIFEADYGPRIVDSDVPAKLSAGQSLTAKVVLRNNGVRVWDRKRTGVGCHWYHLDGLEMRWDSVWTPIPATLKPGWPAIAASALKAPEYDGRYVVVWDVNADGQWLSTLPLSRGGDILPVFVEVSGGRLVFADLAGLFDVSAMSPDTNRTAGDFDGKGSSFPAEHMPPDTVGPASAIQGEKSEPGISALASRLYPSGYKWDREAAPDGRISFLYPDKSSEPKSAVACDGQEVPVEHGKYVAVHILGASSAGDAQGMLSLNYEDGAEELPLSMSDWGAGPTHGEKIGFAVRHRHSRAGDEIGKYCYLYHYTIKVNPRRTLTSITLPRNKSMKVVAVTFERTAVRSAP